MRYFKAEITDSDGEIQAYHFSVRPNWINGLWKVTDHIWREMNGSGDFYGHKQGDTINLTVNELVEAPEAPIHTIAL